jgi:hypothetical protein
LLLPIEAALGVVTDDYITLYLECNLGAMRSCHSTADPFLRHMAGYVAVFDLKERYRVFSLVLGAVTLLVECVILSGSQGISTL